MASLKIKNGGKRSVVKGYVDIEGSCVVLREIIEKNGSRVAFAYCLLPGETITSEGDDYIVEF